MRDTSHLSDTLDSSVQYYLAPPAPRALDLDRIECRLFFLEKLIEDKQNEVRCAPPGTIKLRREKGRTYWRYAEPSFQIPEDIRHLNTNDSGDMALLSSVAARSYDETVLRRADREYKALIVLRKIYQNGIAEDVYLELSGPRQELIRPIYLTEEQFVEEWLSQPYTVIPIPPGVQTYLTDRGERVRSKSEVFIANALLKYGIPYFYEYPVRIRDHLTHQIYTAHPDFYVLNPRTRQAYLWEHLGRMDDAEYCAHNSEKLLDYEDAGIIPGQNLILTLETRKSPLTPERIEEVIKRYLL